jgi:hypothetical protein
MNWDQTNTKQNEKENDTSYMSDGVNKTRSKSIVSKRILCELLKTDSDSMEQEAILEISKKFDFLIDVILNRGNNKIHYINKFMCYIVEINSDLIKVLPEYNELKEDINLRFIIPAKNIYNYAIEVYFSIYDLYNVNILT